MAFGKVTLTGVVDNLKEGWTKFNSLVDDLLSTSSGKGASQIGIHDSAGNLTATNVEAGLAEIFNVYDGARVLSETFMENPSTTTGLTWGYKGGVYRLDQVVTTVAAGTVGLTDDAVNYIEVDPSDGGVKKNTSAFTSGRIPIRQVTASSGVQTVSTDKRAWFAIQQMAGATDSVAGSLEIATNDEVITGTANNLAIVPSALTAWLADIGPDKTEVGYINGLTGPIMTLLGNKQDADADTAKTDVANVWEKAQSYGVSVLSSASGVLTWDLNLYPVATATLSENITSIVLQNAAPGTGYELTLIQDGTGSRTVAFPAGWMFPNKTAPVKTAAANSVDIISLSVIGTTETPIIRAVGAPNIGVVA